MSLVLASRRTGIPSLRGLRAHLILNPTAGAGRGARDCGRILAALADLPGVRASHDLTTARGDAARLARHAARGGADLLIAAGGDGTIHEVVNGLFAARADGFRRCDLGVLDCGTGSGFAQSLGLPRTLEGQVGLVARGSGAPLDVGHVTCRRPDRTRTARVYVSECQVGIGAHVAAALGTKEKRLGGRIGFGLAALRAALRQRARPTTVWIDGERIERPLLGVAIGNGSRCAGGMRLTPNARLDDGRLDVLLIHDLPLHARLPFLTRLYRGTHVRHAGCTVRQARRVRVDVEGEAPVAADGEALGQTPCAIEVLPAALRVRRP